VRGESTAFGAKLTAGAARVSREQLVLRLNCGQRAGTFGVCTHGVYVQEARSYWPSLLLTGLARSLLYSSTSEGA
jgi:hypothetical protein